MNEYPMYTDVRLVGEVKDGCGPYSFLNSLPFHEAPGKIQVGFVFRCAFFGDPMNKHGLFETNEDGYHGGTLSDEISALSSLILGARVRAGDCSRTFGVIGNDPMGSPRSSLNTLPTLSRRNVNFVVPSIASSWRDLKDLSAIKSILELRPAQTISLMRAARLYQDSLWIAESEPELAWLMLVAALESGALSWHQKDQTPVELLKAVKGDFSIELEKHGADVLNLVASEIAQLFQSTSKFINFCSYFLPEAPAGRPPQFWQINWTKKNWKQIFNKIYGYRSRALHQGLPFPRPMCEPPERYGDDSFPCEKGTSGLAVRTLGSSWHADALPVSLNTFVQLTREILLAWWKRMAADNINAESSTSSAG